MSPKDNTEQIKNKCPQCNIELISKPSIEEHSQLKHEKTMHQETKKALNALQLQFNQCKNELMVVQEEKERLSIKVNDLKATIDIKNKITQEEPYITSKNTNETNKTFMSNEREIFHCQECDFPLKTLKEKNDHILNHKPNNVKDNGKQQCYLCKKDFYTDKVFKSHVLIHHQSEFNCQECDFQAGASQIILSKHMNLRHRHESEQTDDTFNCEECNMQFSSKWNCNNHKRDKHEPNIECIYYRQGSCKFTDNECWNRHTKDVAAQSPLQDKATVECFVCKNKFKSKNEMMHHRKNTHPEKVRQCNNPESCGLTKYWYFHTPKQNETSIIIEEETNNTNDKQKEGNFQETQIPQKPPLNPKMSNLI